MKIDISNIKKSFLLAALIALLLVIFVITATVRLAARSELAFRSPVRILKNPVATWVVPESLIFDKGDRDGKEIETGQKIGEKSFIRTGEGGEVDLRFDDGTLIRIAENSQASIADISLKETDISLEKGRIISRFQKITGSGNHRVETPNAVCGIRGTELIFDAGPEGTTIYGMSGLTEVASPDHPENPVLLGFQQKTRVNQGALPSPPEEMSDEEVAYFRMLLDSLHNEVVVLVTSTLSFKPDSAELTPESGEELSRIASILKKKRIEVEIAGHTADVGDRASQYTLSLQRAESVKRTLVILGVKERRLSVKGYGGSRPIASNDSQEGRAQNRRVEFLVR